MKPLTRTVLTPAAILVTVTAALAQQPESIRPAVLIQATPTLSSDFAAARSPLAVIERLLWFDANKDHRITRDELPDRMQALIARGDKNADAALDVDEVRAMVNATSSERNRVAVRFQPSEGLAGVIDDLKLPPTKREQALVIVNTHKLAPNVKEQVDRGVYRDMRALLDNEDYENFVAAAERLSKTTQFRAGGVISGIVQPPPPPPAPRR